MRKRRLSKLFLKQIIIASHANETISSMLIFPCVYMRIHFTWLFKFITFRFFPFISMLSRMLESIEINATIDSREANGLYFSIFFGLVTCITVMNILLWLVLHCSILLTIIIIVVVTHGIAFWILCVTTLFSEERLSFWILNPFKYVRKR